MATGGREENEEEWASQLLSKLCEDVGFSEEEWRFRLRTCDVCSTSENYCHVVRKSLYNGSSSEGVAADILGSCESTMYLLSGIKVTESDVISPDEEDDVYKAITSNHPAFYTMNLRHEGNGLIGKCLDIRTCLEIDPHSKMIVLNGTRVKAMFSQPRNAVSSETVQHGPALTTKTNCELGLELNYVISLHCPSWPTVYEEWKHRLKPSGWPSPELVERVTKLGCAFVPTGNPLSLQNEIEWRLSSSAAERVLIRSFNIVQIQSYFLLKLVLVHLIKPCVPDYLRSYHMKSIMLWQVEKTDPRVWRRENLAHCFKECLKALYQCLDKGNLPHYFIPQQNMFDPKIQGEVRRKLIGLVGKMIDDTWPCLRMFDPFKCTAIGCMHNVLRCPCYIREMSRHRTWNKVRELYSQLQSIAAITMFSLGQSTEDSLDQTVIHIQTLQMNTVTDEIYRPSRSSIDMINTAMSNHMGYMMFNVTRGPHDLKAVENHLENNCDFDMTSCRLKLATFYYRLGDVNKCIRLVHDVRLKFTTKTVVFSLNPIRLRRNAHPSRIVKHLAGLMSISDDIRDVLRHVSYPVLFSTWEIINAPPAIQAIAVHRRLEPGQELLSSQVVAIDSLVYAYYLLTISYREIGRPDQAEKSLDYLKRVLLRPEHYQIYYPYEAQQLVDHCTRPK